MKNNKNPFTFYLSDNQTVLAIKTMPKFDDCKAYLFYIKESNVEIIIGEDFKNIYTEVNNLLVAKTKKWGKIDIATAENFSDFIDYLVTNTNYKRNVV